MSIPTESLTDERQFDRIRKSLRGEAEGWGRSDREKRLKVKYWRAPRAIYRALKVEWDCRTQAKRLNLEASPDYLRECRLYECDAAVLRSHMWETENFDFEFLFDTAAENILLRVVGHWEVGTPLTPPALTLREGSKLGKFDGFHRLAVAFAADSLAIPFWAVLPCPLAGVRLRHQA